MLEHERLMDIRSKVAPIQGWVSDEAGMNLYRLVKHFAPTGYVIEVGSWRGRSTTWLGHGVKDRGEGHVYAVDTWKGSPEHQEILRTYFPDVFGEFQTNMNKVGLSSYITPMQGDSRTMWRHYPPERQAGLLFIDGDHDYENVKQDFMNWMPFVAKGGFIVFDDVPCWPGPTAFVQHISIPHRFVGSNWNNYMIQKL
ncbi:class I SAM-dependent methyltransferase [Paenibacillus sp. y28]|uniref:class I SAM-dependent methyltransferase n=1 Tax=Paenibacillus sp. y28 TaxID=3129110 RepID=UPI00301B14C9